MALAGRVVVKLRRSFRYAWAWTSRDAPGFATEDFLYFIHFGAGYKQLSRVCTFDMKFPGNGFISTNSTTKHNLK
jgi:hypothetical protein